MQVELLNAAIEHYLRECSRIARSGIGTPENSYYPALNGLLASFGAQINPPIHTVPHPSQRDGDLPDVGLYEARSQVLVLPVEAKPFEADEGRLIGLPQAMSYARTFGGNHVLLTNLWQFIWAELTPTGMVVRGKVSLTAGAEALRSAQPAGDPDAARQLFTLLESATALRATLVDPRRAARLVAHHARTMLDTVNELDKPETLLAPLAQTMKTGLGMDLDASFFMSTVIQTLAYGVFAAWLESVDPQAFRWQDTPYLLHPPVIGTLFHQIIDPDFVAQCDLTEGLGAIQRVLNWVDRAAFSASFDLGAIEYFYEPFLAAFDSDLRDKLGVWYTPREIADYQVARVDKHLRDDFGLADGIADPTVQVLDPASGTGTYLAAVYRWIYEYHRGNGLDDATAARRVLEAARTRIHGFEILPAALVISHLHLAHLLRSLGAPLPPNDRVSVYLTNSLLGWNGSPLPHLPLHGFEDELTRAQAIKTSAPVLVILGNPPYQGFSAAETDEEKALIADWIAPLWPIYHLRKNRLGDLYVRFWRAAIKKIAEYEGRGVISFITNRKWLAGRSYPSMRKSLVDNFEAIVVDDLHGDVHDTTHPGDGSVFTTASAPGIQRGVAIVTAIKTEPGRTGSVTAMLRDFRGSGSDKRTELMELAGNRIDERLVARDLTRANRWRFTAPNPDDSADLSDYMPWFKSGVQPVRDEAVVDTDRSRLERRMEDYFDASLSFQDLVTRHPGFGVTRSRYNGERTRRLLLTDSAYDPAKICRYAYRPFDERWLYWEPHHKLLNEPRRELMPFYADGVNQKAIVVPQCVRRPGGARPMVTSAVPCYHMADPDARVVPLYRVDIVMGFAEPPAGAGKTVPLIPANVPQASIDFEHVSVSANVDAAWIDLARAVGVPGNDEEIGVAVFHALIAVMNSPAWVDTVLVDTDEFPPVPLPTDLSVFTRASNVGAALAGLYDVSIPVDGVTVGRLRAEIASVCIPHIEDTPTVAAGRRPGQGPWSEAAGGTVRVGPGFTLTGVSEEVWRFSVGGHQVLPKWLSYRKETTLSHSELEDLCGIARRIAAIIAVGPDCDALYDSALSSHLDLQVV